ncbi:hypothetical protein D3C78_1418070 [compost metagenome]
MSGPGDDQTIYKVNQQSTCGLQEGLVELCTDSFFHGLFRCFYRYRVDPARHLGIVAHGPEEKLGLCLGYVGVGGEPRD